MASKSELVKRLDIKDRDELNALTAGSQHYIKKVASKVILQGLPYEKAGEPAGMTRHAVYELLKRLYKKKFGVNYGKN